MTEDQKDFYLAVQEEIVGIENKYSNLVSELEEQLKREQECVDFYAKPNESYVRRLTTYTRYKDDFDIYNDTGYKLKLIGKLARETQKMREINKLK